MPKVSVMMPVYNGARYLERSIRSVLGQTFQDFELLVIDDGSTDRSNAIIADFAGRDDRIRYRSRPNRGIVASRNEILEMATGEYVSVLDHDDIAPPRRIEVAVDYLQRHPDHVGVGGDMEIIDEDGDTLVIWTMRRSHEEIDRALMEGGLVIGHPAATMRRADMLAVGGYRSPYETAEDLDLFLRLAERGRLANLPEIMVKYRVHLNNSGSSRVGVSRQADAALAALNDARIRRRLSGPAIRPPAEIRPAAQEHVKWGWWALGSGHVRTARKHARRALWRNPFVPESWKLLLCAFRHM